jgi:hypothetical protein
MRANSTVDRSLLHINQLPRRREVIAHTLSRLLSLPEDGLTWARFHGTFCRLGFSCFNELDRRRNLRAVVGPHPEVERT